MKVKTSITLSRELLRAIDRYQSGYNSRSEFLEAAARSFLARLEREKAERHDLEIINRHADELNAEAEDVLAYQVSL
jgi:metal-responsive CopG/Arc/MetJ family transcriptional regulator